MTTKTKPEFAVSARPAIGEDPADRRKTRQVIHCEFVRDGISLFAIDYGFSEISPSMEVPKRMLNPDGHSLAVQRMAHLAVNKFCIAITEASAFVNEHLAWPGKEDPKVAAALTLADQPVFVVVSGQLEEVDGQVQESCDLISPLVTLAEAREMIQLCRSRAFSRIECGSVIVQEGPDSPE